MNYSIVLTILVLFETFAQSIHAGWEAKFYVEANRATIVYFNQSDKGHPTFSEALNQLAKDNHIEKLDGIDLFDLMKDETFQKELFFTLERDSPHELKGSLKSAGNMHNPKVQDLWEPFLKAVIATPTVQELNKSLAPYGLHVSRATQEEFQLKKTPEGKRFFSILSLEITKLHSQVL